LYVTVDFLVLRSSPASLELRLPDATNSKIYCCVRFFLSDILIIIEIEINFKYIISMNHTNMQLFQTTKRAVVIVQQ